MPVTALLDVGELGRLRRGGDRRSPGAGAAVFERPPVDVAARTLLAARGLDDRIDVVTGDMFTDRCRWGSTCTCTPMCCTTGTPSGSTHLLASSFAALPPGGTLIDHDTHVAADKRGPLPVAEYSVLLMHSTPGKCWSVGELTGMAQHVGFVDVEHRPAAGDRGVLLARKPG